jgi:holo-[acyl-carrier protein] synthase
MTILGIGTDIIEISRIQASLRLHGTHFINRIFTSNEQTYCKKYTDPSAQYAGRFAAKEAIAKALGCGIGKKLSWLDIEVINNTYGKPEVFLSIEAQAKWKNPQLLITISHSDCYATAVAIWSTADTSKNC